MSGSEVDELVGQVGDLLALLHRTLDVLDELLIEVQSDRRIAAKVRRHTGARGQATGRHLRPVGGGR